MFVSALRAASVGLSSSLRESACEESAPVQPASPPLASHCAADLGCRPVGCSGAAVADRYAAQRRPPTPAPPAAVLAAVAPVDPQSPASPPIETSVAHDFGQSGAAACAEATAVLPSGAESHTRRRTSPDFPADPSLRAHCRVAPSEHRSSTPRSSRRRKSARAPQQSAAGVHRYDHVARPAGVGRPALLSGDDPLVALAHGSHFGIGRVAAAPRLR